MSARRAPTVFDSFNNAAEGIIHVVRTQRNMRIHFAVAFIVIVAALIINVTKLELIALLISITFVLIAEMLNTGIEAAIDIATTSFDPMAKLAKDIAAGAVLIATVNAIIVGYFVFAVLPWTLGCLQPSGAAGPDAVDGRATTSWHLLARGHCSSERG